jgi:hypothetical protein
MTKPIVFPDKKCDLTEFYFARVKRVLSNKADWALKKDVEHKKSTCTPNLLSFFSLL